MFLLWCGGGAWPPWLGGNPLLAKFLRLCLALVFFHFAHLHCARVNVCVINVSHTCNKFAVCVFADCCDAVVVLKGCHLLISLADKHLSHIVPTLSSAMWAHFSVDVPTPLVHYPHMRKSVFIKVRVTPEEKQAYLDAASAAGKPISDIIRASLARLVARVKK